jgi:hypothetical protein
MRLSTMVTLLAATLSFGCNNGHVDLTDSGSDAGDSGLDSGLDSGVTDASCSPPTPYGCFFQPGQDVWVDGFGGADDAGACCCGQPFVPCQTLTYAMATISDGGTVGVQIHAYLSDGGVVWPNSHETWPVHLGFGVSVTAPDVLFSPPDLGNNEPRNYDVFQVYPYSSTDVQEVTIQGDPNDVTKLVRLGLPLDAGLTSPVLSAIENGPALTALTGLPLRISNAWLQGQETTLVIGSMASATIGPLPVHIGSFFGRLPGGGVTGIACSFATVQDTGHESLQIDSHEYDILASYGCSMSLVHGPSLGFRPDGGFMSCPAMRDGYGLSVGGSSTVAIGSFSEPAELHCFRNDAIDMGNGGPGSTPPFASPSVTFLGHESNAACRGASIAGGSFTTLSSTIAYNQVGIWVFDLGALLLDSFGVVAPTQISCNSLLENPAQDCSIVAGMVPPYSGNVAISNSPSNSDLNEVVWNHWDDDAGTPQVWTCYDVHSLQCSCEGPDCPSSATDGGRTTLPASPEPDVIYQGAAVDSGPFIFTGGAEGSCP